MTRTKMKTRTSTGKSRRMIALPAVFAASMVAGLALGFGGCGGGSSGGRIQGAPLTQVDRAGKPAIETVLVGTPLAKDDFNRTAATGDSAFVPGAIAILTGFPFNQTLADATADVNLLFPTPLGIDTAQPTDYAMLNGRKLEDDVVDISLGLLTNGGIATDNVDASTKSGRFLGTFPFLGPPLAPQ